MTYGYDLDGRMTSVSDNSAAIASAVPPSGTTTPQYTMTYSYDALNRRQSAGWDNVVAAPTPPQSSVSFTHTFNKNDRRIGQTTNDNSYWLYPAAVASTTNFTANSLNQYTAVGSVTPTYDTNGNLTNDGTFTYTYDAENRLVSAVGAGHTASYTYDAQGRRKTKTVDGTTTVFVSNRGREIMEYDGTSGSTSGTILRRYVFGNGIDEALNQINVSANSRSTLVPDIQGSVIASIDAATSTITKTGYGVYGGSPDVTGSYRYTGRRIDFETGLYYYRARMYSPALGRFMQPDPIRYAGGNNLYAYVNDDPLNATDPFGRFGILASLGLTAEVGAGDDPGGIFKITNTNTNSSTTISGVTGYPVRNIRRLHQHQRKQQQLSCGDSRRRSNGWRGRICP